ncbi:MAG: MarR family transcriptional regulator [Rhodospirillales bacterium]|nr:MarR family transcriptional regulator [Rhodospirillales bacterium]
MDGSSLKKQSRLPLCESTGFLMRDTHLTVARVLRSRLQGARITLSQWYFLRAMWSEEGLSQRELASRVGITEPSTLSALRKLEKNGFVRKVRNARDRRANTLYLTEAGQNLEGELIHHAVEVNSNATRGFSDDELATLHDYLRRIKTNLMDEISKDKG